MTETKQIAVELVSGVLVLAILVGLVWGLLALAGCDATVVQNCLVP